VVLDATANTATLVDIVRTTASAALPVGTTPVWAASSADGNTIYVLNQGSSDITVINAAVQAVSVPSVPTGGTSPSFIVADHQLNRLYVSNTNTGSTGTISVFDTSAGSVVSITAATASTPPMTTTYTYTLTSGPALQTGTSIVITGMADAGNNGTFMITAVGAGTFTVANASGVTTSTAQTGKGAGPTSASLIGLPIPVGFSPKALAVTPDGSKVYVANTGSPFASVIDGNSLSVVGTITPIANDPTATVTWVAISKDGTKAYVAAVVPSNLTNTTEVVQTANNSPIVNIAPPQQNPACVATVATPCPLQRPFQIVPRL
jgi:YVTN family beta-propeller protein